MSCRMLQKVSIAPVTAAALGSVEEEQRGNDYLPLLLGGGSAAPLLY